MPGSSGVIATKENRSRAGTLLAALLAGSSLLLAGCSGRDTNGAEKIAAAQDAAARAEKAAERAEAAAAKIEKGQTTVVEAEPDATDDAGDAAVAAEDKPEDPAPTDRG